ncbi:MAG: DNA-directed RNA polymerase subunit K [Nanoarchaeota archaeon]
MAKTKESEVIKLTKYERARLIGSRALQISMGAPFAVKLTKKELESIGYNPIEIAKKELEADKIPIDVVREVTMAKARG